MLANSLTVAPVGAFPFPIISYYKPLIVNSKVLALALFLNLFFVNWSFLFEVT